ncbi:unannotated protein [freshwater metagenome]|uniref:Unannotated protein n=1 Tax=freshwater metagenome TaxID=449393 RepID=A0A6J6MUB3_9ZZZZ
MKVFNPWITSGAGYPINSAAVRDAAALRMLCRPGTESWSSPRTLPLQVIRAVDEAASSATRSIFKSHSAPSP